MMTGTLLELLELGGPGGGHRAARPVPSRAAQGTRPHRARLRVPGPGDPRRVPVPSRRAAPARTAPAAPHRPRHPDAAHPTEAAALSLIHAPRMNQ
jgi:hypothetical protein